MRRKINGRSQRGRDRKIIKTRRVGKEETEALPSEVKTKINVRRLYSFSKAGDTQEDRNEAR